MARWEIGFSAVPLGGSARRFRSAVPLGKGGSSRAPCMRGVTRRTDPSTGEAMAGKRRRRRTLDEIEDEFLQVLDPEFTVSGDSGGEEAEEEAVLEAEEGAAALAVVVSEDGMVAELRSRGKAVCSSADLFALLEQEGIVYGIDRAAVEVAASQIAGHGRLPAPVVVARGTPPVPQRRVVFTFLERVVDADGAAAVWMVEGTPLFADLAGVFAIEDRQELDSLKNVAVKAVARGELLGRLEEVADHRPGRTVYGAEIEDGGWQPVLGENVEFDEESGEYRARVYGYVHAEEDFLDVVEPVWIAPDKMTACYVNLPQIGRPVAPEYADISGALLRRHVKPNLLLSRRIHALCAKLASGGRVPQTVAVARGRQPVPGRDAEFVLHVDIEVRAGTLRDDDTIDLRERNIVAAVAKDTLVAEKRKTTKGTPGSDLFGGVLPAEDGKDYPLTVGKGVRKEDRGDRVQYWAEYDGNLSYRYDTLTVARVFSVTGDVDYTTGNVRVKTDLTVAGSVRPGFQVKADGNVEIKGMVESGALVECAGNLKVADGIIGADTRIVVRGDLEARFLQDAEVLAGGDVVVGSYVYNSLVRAGGAISVRKATSSAGKVVGGMLVASRGIECATVGSPTNRSTVVALQPAPELRAGLRRLDSRIKECQEIMHKTMRTLGLTTVDPLAIRARLAKVPPDKREMVTRLLVNLSALIKRKKALDQERRELLERIEGELGKAAIRVTSEFFQGNEVRIGEHRFVAPTDLGPSVFQLRDGHIVR